MFQFQAASLDSNMSAGSQTSGISVPVPTGVITGQGGPGGNSLLPSSADDTGRGRGSVDYGGLDFRLIVDTHSGPPVTINLVASTLQEKAAWCSDIGQVGVNCFDQLYSLMTKVMYLAMITACVTGMSCDTTDFIPKKSISINSLSIAVSATSNAIFPKKLRY